MSEVQRWLTFIGLGEDGLAGLSPAASARLAQASFIVGGARHLALIGETSAQVLAWPSPIEGAYTHILARRGHPTCVLASGDPFFHGIGEVLARQVGADEIECFPALSAFALASARMGWAQQDCVKISLHGRALERIIRFLQPGARILALSWDETTPQKLAALLSARDMGDSKLTILSSMGGPDERRATGVAAKFMSENISPLNVIALEVVAERGARIVPRAPGLPDDWFVHDGQITKRDMRALSLSALAPRAGELLWDIGAGSGSMSIEWMLCDMANRAIAIEQNGARAANIRANALALGTPDLKIIEGGAPQALKGLEPPDAIFIGGGATRKGVIDAAYAALKSGGRLVVNAVTLETQAELTARFKALGGRLTLHQNSEADAVGGFHGWRAAMPVVQWRVEKP